jgi:anti-sigma B factor antagonist
MSVARDRLELSAHRSGPVLRMAVAGEVDLATVPDLRAAVDQLAAPGMTVALDLHELTFLDLAGVQELIRLAARARRQGWRLELTGVTPRAYELAQACGLDVALVFRRASEALVADAGGGRVVAMALYDEPTPFSFTNGPETRTVEEAVAWARRRADRVVVRLGGERFSAGVDPVPDLAPFVPSGGWSERPDATPPGSAPAPAPARAWRVRAGTVWHAGDAPEVAARLERALRHEPAVGDVCARAGGRALDVTFRIAAHTAGEAREHAGESLRVGWREVGIEALAGEHFDRSFIDVARR